MAIEKFKSKILAKDLTKTTVNRYLATLRKTLRYASRKLKLFGQLPVIEMYSQEDGAERQRKFIFSDTDYTNWIGAAPEPLAVGFGAGAQSRHLPGRDACIAA